MPKDRCCVKDFVELVYDGQLLHFIGKVLHGLLMEDGVPIHQSKLFEEWRKIFLVEKSTNSPELNPLGNLLKFLKDVV